MVMSKHSEREKQKEVQKHRENLRKEKLAEYFFSMSNTILGSLIIAVIILLIGDDNNYNEWKLGILLGLGTCVFVAFGKVGNNILK